MNDEIDEKLFLHLVELAALELTEEEAIYLRNQLNQQLQVVHEMDSIPLEADVDVSAHGIQYDDSNSPQIRTDEEDPTKTILDLSKIAPQFNNDYIIVPEIPHTKL